MRDSAGLPAVKALGLTRSIQGWSVNRVVAVPARVGTVYPSAPAVHYSDEHLVCAELAGASRAPWWTGFLPSAPGVPKSHFRDRSGDLKLKRLRRCCCC